MRPRIINGILFFAGLLLWVALLGFFLMQQVVAIFPDKPASLVVGGLWYNLVLSGFLVVQAYWLERVFRNIEKLHVTTMLWRLFIIGMGGITVIMLITFGNRFTNEMTLHAYLTPIYFCLGLYATVVFFLSALFIYRRFILYPRTRRKITLWWIMIALLALSLVFNFYDNPLLALISYIPFILITLFLSANVRWISYLNFNQKLRALGLFVLITLVIATYVIAARRLPSQLELGLGDTFRIEFVYYIIFFALCYSVAAMLVLFFNLPTSSLFERESVEIASFQKINQAIQSNLDFTDILNTLLDASMLATNAKGGWVELIEPGAAPDTAAPKISKRISLREIEVLKQKENITAKVLTEQKPMHIRNLGKHKLFRSGKTRFKCLVAVPIMSSNHQYGAVIVIHDLVNAFEDVSIKSLNSYAEQAGIALENAELIRNSFELERYQEQLKIAKEVQNQLLPHVLPQNDQVEFVAMSENAQEVGGDYFDVVEAQPGQYRVAIGDVSGKGTTAAFYMAEMKGVFHALSSLDLSTQDFISTANNAMKACMQRGLFMTLTYLQIDVNTRKLEMIRAGHCPAYYYHASSGQLSRLDEGTLGLGIVGRKIFDAKLKPSEPISYEPGDFMVLYTDGITEARNATAEEYGYERLESCICLHKESSAASIASAIVSSVKEFARADLHDDYTVLVIRLH
ncbi:MAG: SpoIIE family protein phosphatase [Bacteroidota bacterium]